jgi:hypothetical protein
MKDTSKIDTGKQGEKIAVAFLKKTVIASLKQIFVVLRER